MSSGNPVSATGPNVNPSLVIAPNANPVAKPSLGARIKATAETIWSVVKPILIILAIVIGAAASTALLGFVTVTLSPAILWTAVGVAAVALLYLLFKVCQRASLALDERKLRKELIQLKLDNPAIAQKLQALQTNGFDRASIYSLIKLHKANEHLKADPNKNLSQSFAEIRKKVTAHLDGELNKNFQPPTLTIPDYCQTEQDIIAYVTAAAEKRDLLIKSINNISSEKALPVRANQATFLAIADKVAKKLQDKINQLDNDLTQYLQSHQDKSCPYASIPNYCSKPENIVSYIERIVENAALVDNTITALNAELTLKKQDADKNIDLITYVTDVVSKLQISKKQLGEGFLVAVPEFCKLKNVTLEFVKEAFEKYLAVTKVYTLLTNEIQTKQAICDEDKRLIAAAKKVAAIAKKVSEQLMVDSKTLVPGFCFYTGKDYLVNVTAVAHKQERIEKAINHIKTTAGVDRKVDKYFQDTLAKLQKGINVPLPNFFHGTRSGVASIISTKTIRQSGSGWLGSGTYISNNNEGHNSYGPHTFAIDEGTLVDTTSVYAHARAAVSAYGEIFSSLWIAVHKHISISDESIAFIDTDNNDVDYLEKLVKAQGLNIAVIERTTSDAIRGIFDKTTEQRDLPSFGWAGSGPFPANMRVRTV